MYQSSTSIRIHYAFTDQMGFVYYGHYAQFYEIGRTEAIRALGLTYKDMEAMGVIMPVVEMQCRFLRPAKYDDLITVKTILKELPENHEIFFHGEVYNEAGKLLNTGLVTLYFLSADGLNRITMPENLREKLQPFFSEKKV